jgi:hypothetical protein
MAKADRAVPPGHVLIRLDDLAALIAARASAPDVSAWQVLASVIAIVSARRAGLSDAGLLGDVPPARALRCMSMLATALTECLPGDAIEEALADIGLRAAAEKLTLPPNPER